MNPSKELLLECGAALDRHSRKMTNLRSVSEVRKELSEAYLALLLLVKAHERTLRGCGVSEEEIYRLVNLTDCSTSEMMTEIENFRICGPGGS